MEKISCGKYVKRIANVSFTRGNAYLRSNRFQTGQMQVQIAVCGTEQLQIWSRDKNEYDRKKRAEY